MSKQFRPYQLEASSAIIKAWGKHRSCLASLATGAGKTVIAAGVTRYVVEKNQGRVLFLANRNELCVQPLATFSDQLGFVPALEKAEAQAPLDARVVIGSVQTLARQKRLERFPQDHFGYIFADEAHMSMAPSWRRILDHFKAAKLCGITATPFRADAKSLTDLYETEAFRLNLFDLVDQGWLVNPDHVYKLESAISLAQVRVKKTTEGVDYDLQDAATAIEPYFLEIAREIKQQHAERKILAFLPLVASSQKFVAACQSVGLNAVHIDGEDVERDQKLRLFKDGQIQLLSNANLLHTGVDIPVCDCTLNLRPTKSKVLYVQIIGRSTRTVPGLIDGLDTVEGRLKAIAGSAKPQAYILDPLWLTADHDLVTPSFLIAPNQADAEEMNRRATKSYSLRALSAQVQAEREAAILKRLSDAARFRENRVDYKFFAAATEDHALVNYEPVYKWEEHPPTKFSKLLLQQAGIDAESVASEGLARQIMLAIGRRRYRGLAEIGSLSFFAERTGITPQLWKITKKEAATARR